MLRVCVIMTHTGLALAYLSIAMMRYLEQGAELDAGAVPLFLAFWFGFAAFGFYRKNVWLITMAALALICFFSLNLLMNGLALIHSGAGVHTKDFEVIVIDLGLLAFTIAGEGFALWYHNRVDKG